MTPLISLASAKSGVPIRDGNFSFDEKVALYLATATESIERHSNRLFTYAARSDLFNTVPNLNRVYASYGGDYNESGINYVPRRQTYVLRGYPIDPAMPVVVYYDPTRAFTIDTIVDPSLYIVNYETGTISLTFGMGNTMQGLRVDYSGGYQPYTDGTYLVGVSNSLQLATRTQVAFLWNKLHADNVGMDADRTKGAANRANMVQKFITPSGLCPEAAELIGYPIKIPAMGRA